MYDVSLLYVQVPNDPDDSNNSDPEDMDTYESLFASFTEKWMETQLTHHVSLAGANAFWKLSFQYVNDICKLKTEENIAKNIPQFVHVRRQVQKEICPNVLMSFAFMNKNDGSMIYIRDDHTPLNKYQRDPRFKKIYEEAHIQVSAF